ncbi:heme ABC transporter ATP-binding protein, partial [Candidatus Geothermarchaeota archaeon]
AGTLSGGNLQKLVLARELSLDPPLIIAVNPSKTLDHFSTELLHSTLIKYRDRGKAILLVSEDSEEVMKVSDRIMVMHEGNLYELGSRDEVDLGLIEEYMIRGGEVEEVIKVG